MKSVEIKGLPRTEFGKKSSNDARREGMVPCVLYGGGENIHFTADEREFKKLVYTPHVYTVDLKIDGKEHKAVLKDIQFHPLHDNILHADFYQLLEDRPIVMEIPVWTEGTAVGVKDGGLLVRTRRKLAVRALPKDLPDDFTLNVEKLKIGESILINEIEAEGVEFLEDGEKEVVGVKTKRSLEVLEALETAVEGEEEELEEGEEGEEPTAEGEEAAEGEGGEEGAEGGEEKSEG